MADSPVGPLAADPSTATTQQGLQSIRSNSIRIVFDAHDQEASSSQSLLPGNDIRTPFEVNETSSSRRPVNTRAITEPSPSKLLQAHRAEIMLQQQQQQQQQQQRSRSPFSRAHLRSYSASSSTSTAQDMHRTRSLPIVGDSSRSVLRRCSPSHSPVRSASPLRSTVSPVAVVPRSAIGARRSFEEFSSLQSGLSSSFTEIEIIEEDSELEVAPRPQTLSPETADSASSPWTSFGATQQYTGAYTFSRPGSSSSSSNNSRRRPASPLHYAAVTHSPSSTPPTVHATLHSHGTSTSLNTTPSSQQPHQLQTFTTSRYNEPFPQSATSSVPSTPTSLRSRSPSISSLETIPDSPDAEEAAIEAFEIAKLKSAADEADNNRERNWGSLGLVSGSAGTGKQDKRKRWSVCGAERRGDFEMETIWED